MSSSFLCILEYYVYVQTIFGIHGHHKIILKGNCREKQKTKHKTIKGLLNYPQQWNKQYNWVKHG